MIYADDDGPIYEDNGIALHRVEYPHEVGETSVITAKLQIAKKELFPLENRCEIDGKGAKIIAIVDNATATEKTMCVQTIGGSTWNQQIDIPLMNDGDTGTYDVSLYFVQPNDGANQFETSWRDMPESTITFTTEVVPEGEEPPPGAWEECDTVLGQDNCPDGFVCYDGICTPENQVPDDPDDGNGDDPDNGNGDDPDNGNGDNGDGGDGVVGGLSGQTLLVGLVGAGLWARSRRDDK